MIRELILGAMAAANTISRKMAQAVGLNYHILVPFATYAPWNGDKEFLELFSKIKKDCLVDLYQCWELWALGQQMAHMGGDFIEVGVWRGGTSCILGRSIKKAGTDTHLYCCDTFSGVVKAGEEDNFYEGGEHADTTLADTEARLRANGVLNFTTLTGIFPEDTGDQVTDKRFALCHVDVDTYRSAEDIFNWVWPRLQVGGAVVFQDYGFFRAKGINKLVESFREREDAVVVHNLNGNGLVFKNELAS